MTLHPHDHAPEAREPLARGAGRGALLYLDAASGLSGDMLVAALLDLGVPVAVLDAVLDDLRLGGTRLVHRTTERSGIRARRFEVEVLEQDRERTWSEIASMLESSALAPPVKARAHAAFELLARAEAAVHGVPIGEVHFHEVGAIDSIVDIVGVCALLDHLGAEVVCSPLPLGRGFVRSRHGVLPLPAPATVSCLTGVPTYDGGVEAELVTPTGACLVRTSAARFERWPAMRPSRVGWGAGSRELPDRPNVLRAVLGEIALGERALGEPGAGYALIETNLDDASPELVAHAVERIREAGARDAWTAAVGMKKGRDGHLLSVLSDAADVDRLVRVILTETPSLGVRVRAVDRVERPRRFVEVATRFGPVPIKIADGDGLPRRLKPEHDVCARLAREHGVPLDEVVREARRAAEAIE